MSEISAVPGRVLRLWVNGQPVVDKLIDTVLDRLSKGTKAFSRLDPHLGHTFSRSDEDGRGWRADKPRVLEDLRVYRVGVEIADV